MSLPDAVWEVIDKEFRGKLGDADSEILRNMMVAYLSSNGYLFRAGAGDQLTGLKESLDKTMAAVSALNAAFQALFQLIVEKEKIAPDKLAQWIEDQIHQSAPVFTK